MTDYNQAARDEDIAALQDKFANSDTCAGSYMSDQFAPPINLSWWQRFKLWIKGL